MFDILFSSPVDWLWLGGKIGNPPVDTFAQFYAENLRETLFTALLTVAIFLFSVKTFLLVTLEKEVYGTSEYCDRIKKLSKLNPKIQTHTQLKRLNGLLFWAIAITFFAAVLQLTVGFIGNNLSAAVSVISAVLGFIIVGVAIVIQKIAIRDWLDFLQDKHNKKQVGADSVVTDPLINLNPTISDADNKV